VYRAPLGVVYPPTVSSFARRIEPSSGLDAILPNALYFQQRFTCNTAHISRFFAAIFSCCFLSLARIGFARMKAEHRHELQANALADWMEKAADKVRPYTSLILVGIAALAIVIGILSYLSSAESAGRSQATDQYIGAISSEGIGDLQATITDFRGTQAATLAQLHLADRLLAEGSDTLYTHKPAGRENLQKAAEGFTLVKDETRDPMLRAWALLGLGRAHEALGDLERARGDYNTLLKDYPESSFAATARRNLDQLNETSVKEFYDWFAKQEPRQAPADPTTGVPGMKPSFDIKDPLGDIRLPTNIDPNSPSGIAAPNTDRAPIPPLPEPTAPGLTAPEGNAGDASKAAEGDSKSAPPTKAEPPAKADGKTAPAAK
jgi:tetratricopeptide (TPR) repeat protein